MKKVTTFILVIVSILLSASQAQALIGFGIKGGINNSKILFSPSDAFSNQDYRRGASFGVFFTFNLGQIGLQPEVLYSRRGLDCQMLITPPLGADPSPYLAPCTARLDYIEIPLLVRLNIMPLGPIKVYALGGPSYGILLKANLDITSGGQTDTENIKSDLKSSALAIVGGLGVDLKIPLLFRVTVEARYHYGLDNILSDTSRLLEMTDKARNSGFSIMAGISF
ncbi:MAG TPA: porin family protein [Candidatus Saccharicenans sp.]|nr:porin family protein [Candidatus Saccharicenans sp.]HQM74545.1 porin family protein [Candidatus Saccharicenans sp.]